MTQNLYCLLSPENNINIVLKRLAINYKQVIVVGIFCH